MADEDIFFMRIEDPVEIRKNILESTRMCLQGLQRSQQFKDLRKQKAEKIAELRQHLHEVNKLFIRMRNMMPEAASLPEQEVKKVEKEDRKDPGKEAHFSHINADKSIARLHHQLKAIEHKLDSLS